MYKFSQGLQLNGMGGPDDLPPEPLIEGGNPAWNGLLQHVPEDKRAEVAPILKEWDKNYNDLNQNYAPWKEFSSSDVKPDDVNTALNIMNLLENQPQQVYEVLGKHLGITPKEAKEVLEGQEGTEETKETPEYDITQHPQFKKMNDQMQAMTQIMLANREQEEQSAKDKEAEQAVEQEFKALKDKYGEFDEDQVALRMLKGLSAEEAYNEHEKYLEKLGHKKKEAPYILGGGGRNPRSSLDPKKLNRTETQDLVAQQLGHLLEE